MAIRKATEVSMSGFFVGRHDCADGGDCAPEGARRVEKVTGRELARGLRRRGSIGTRKRDRLEKAEAMRRNWANKTNKNRENLPL